MIISHEHKYIFIKPLSVGGSSIELALKPTLAKDDVLTGLCQYLPERNSLGFLVEGQHEKGYHSHMTPEDIVKELDERSAEYQRFGSDIWNTYEKITIVKNPWKNFITQFEYEKKNISSKDSSFSLFRKIFDAYSRNDSEKKLIDELEKNREEFQELIEKNNFFELIESFPPRIWSNLDYYYNSHRELVCDTHFRAEHLEDDFASWYTHRIESQVPTLQNTAIDNQKTIAHEEYFLQHVEDIHDLSVEQIESAIRRKANLIMYKDDQFLTDFPYEFWSGDPHRIITNYKNNNQRKKAV